MPAPLSPAKRSRRSHLFSAVALSGRLLLAGAAAVSIVAPMLALAPEPDPVPRRWQLDVEPGQLRIISIDVKDVGPRTFAYMNYRAVNNSGQDLLFAPLFELSLGDGSVLRAGRDVPHAVTSQLLATYQDPLIQDQIAIIGEFRQGEENAKHGIVVWPLKDLRPGRVAVYAAGFSGETKTIASPDGKHQFVLRKSLMLDYDTPGDLQGQGAEPIPMRTRSWIMR